MPGEMHPTVGIVERAFELAQQGHLSRVSEVQRTLTKEGYDYAAQHLSSPMLIRQLRQAISAARTVLNAE